MWNRRSDTALRRPKGVASGRWTARGGSVVWKPVQHREVWECARGADPLLHRPPQKWFPSAYTFNYRARVCKSS